VTSTELKWFYAVGSWLQADPRFGLENFGIHGVKNIGFDEPNSNEQLYLI
jgi:hypothetical protein